MAEDAPALDLGGVGPLQLHFAELSVQSVGRFPYMLAVADLDNDHRDDLLVANSDDHTMGAMRGRGDGTFAAQVLYSIPGAPAGIATADWDRDGALDVACASYDSQGVELFRAGCGGVLSRRGNLWTGGSPDTGSSGDFDGDGTIDLLLCTPQDFALSFFRGHGNGEFDPVRHISASSPECQWLAVGDFNGDGATDAAVYAGGNQIDIFLGGPAGPVRAATYPAPRGNLAWPGIIVAADLNNDGKLDLVKSSVEVGGILSLLGHGDGTFASAVLTMASAFEWALVAADLDLDGNVDLVGIGGHAGPLFTEPAYVGVLRGRGDGTFADIERISGPPNPVQLVAADLDRDGRMDLVVSAGLPHEPGSVHILRNLSQ